MKFLRGIFRGGNQPNQPKQPEKFRLLRGQRTQPPIIVPYTISGRGTFAPVQDEAEHIIRVRPWLGPNDPVFLCGGVQTRAVLAKRILEQEKRDISREIWTQFFSPLPTHVVHVAWRSLRTGNYWNILYLPCSFAYAGHHANSLARRWGEYLVDRMALAQNPKDLCPPSNLIVSCQQFWLATSFNYLEWMLIDEPLERWNR